MKIVSIIAMLYRGADQNWYKEYIIANELHQLLKGLNMQYPGLKKDGPGMWSHSGQLFLKEGNTTVTKEPCLPAGRHKEHDVVYFVVRGVLRDPVCD